MATNVTVIPAKPQTANNRNQYKQLRVAGNDLLMPGCVENIDDILTAAQKNDQIAISDLQFCASNILSVILKLTDRTSPIT